VPSLVQALRSASSKGGESREAAEVGIKLARKGDDAALSLDVKTQTRDGKRINVVHDVHVVVSSLVYKMILGRLLIHVSL
jgi:HUS1 checkpoint protein